MLLDFKCALECIDKPFDLLIGSWMEWRGSDIFNRQGIAKVFEVTSPELCCVITENGFGGNQTNKNLLKNTYRECRSMSSVVEYLGSFCVTVYNY